MGFNRSLKVDVGMLVFSFDSVVVTSNSGVVSFFSIYRTSVVCYD